ncbi:MAG: terminase small subunit [Pseudoalteromonas sp.]|uniref:terminase small subunit n=1 Tax=Pseudoalteromonas sp. TaxID=53249 RepID=UPI001DC5D55E|nr:terminase small subunit [Pseudoalteromonas sp.]NRA79859.1 terminase small subunit [Pseudoalteromonas sp.]
MPKPKLTAKQEMFCKEYLIDLNATQAAIRAGYSEKTAKVIGYENLSKPYIAELIQVLMTKRSNKVEIDADWVLKGIKDLTDKLLGSEDPKAAYKGFELAGKHLKLFTDKVELGGKDGEPIAITVIERKII